MRQDWRASPEAEAQISTSHTHSPALLRSCQHRNQPARSQANARALSRDHLQLWIRRSLGGAPAPSREGQRERDRG